VIEQARNDEEQLRNELATDRVAAQTFRDVFLTYNKPWLQGQLHEVFTPRTLFLHRKDIIDQFFKVMGELAPDVSLSEAEAAAQSEAESGGTSRKSKTAKGLPDADGAAQEALVGPETQIVAKVTRYWLVRMRFIRTLRVQVQSLVDLNLEEECAYCGTSEGLNVELLQNIEDLFREFLVATGSPMPGYKFQAWSRYFKEHAIYRTLCAECSEMIQDYHKKKKQLARMEGPDIMNSQPYNYQSTMKQRSSFHATRLEGTDARRETLDFSRAQAAPQEQDSVDPALDQSRGEEARKRNQLEEVIERMGPKHRELASHWIAMARTNLQKKNTKLIMTFRGPGLGK